MDQSAFRSLLASQASTSGSSSTSTSQAHSRAGGGGLGSRSSFGGGKQRLGIGAGFAGQRREQGIPDAATHMSSVEQFRPRQQKSASSSSVSKGRAKEEDKVEEQPKYKKYGYTDRASMRRAGLDEAEIAEAQEERRPRGLDFSKLDPERRQLLGIEAEEEAPVQEEPLPPKTEEEIERELAEAEANLRVESEAISPGTARDVPPAEVQQPQKKQKISRAEMLRDLQAKIAAATTGTVEVKASEPKKVDKRKKTEGAAAADEPAVVKGFKVIERAPEKKKKKRAPEGRATEENHNGAIVARDAANATGAAGTNGEDPASVIAFDDDDDIFGDAGEYDDGLSEEENEANGADNQSVPQTEESGPVKYFDDQDEIIPKFETWKSPTPPPRQKTRSPRHRAESPEEGESHDQKLQRLEGLSSSHYSARELLEMDNALAQEEKRKLRKLKGKEKKEAMERLAELGGGKTAEQKEKDRLNREVQQYESYERKKQKRE